VKTNEANKTKIKMVGFTGILLIFSLMRKEKFSKKKKKET
jgi:hypothetical protein